MTKTMLKLIAKTKANAIKGMNEIAQAFVNENALENIKYLLELIAKLSPTDEGGDASDS